jgi:hypothetical protein
MSSQIKSKSLTLFRLELALWSWAPDRSARTGREGHLVGDTEIGKEGKAAAAAVETLGRWFPLNKIS